MLSLKAEVIEISGSEAKMQVFEETRGIRNGSKVTFEGNLLEAELGPGLLSSIFDGLQNPLEKVGEVSGLFLPRGIYLAPLDREKEWEYTPAAQTGQTVKSGDALGHVPEGRFSHAIMVPFSLRGQYTITWTIEPGNYPIDTIVAKAKDEKGKEHAFSMVQRWPIKKTLMAGKKIPATKMLQTGMRIIDTQFPIVQGGTFCTPGPFGAGKTVLQHHFAKYASVDVVIVTACGERAGEVVEILKEFPHLVDPHTGDPLINRTVIICNTSSMPVAARESSVYMGVTIGEYYRQMGRSVLLLADSTSRWAQAMREMSGRLEEIPGDEAFPAYLASRIAEFYERSGVVELRDKSHGSLTIGGAISPAGGNFEEPVTQSTLSVVGAFLGLSQARAYARRYPAIDALISWSQYLGNVDRELKSEAANWGKEVQRAEMLLRQGDEIAKRIEVVGEEGVAEEEMLIHLKSELYDQCYLQQNSFDEVDKYYPLKEQIALFQLMQTIFSTPFSFPTHDEAHRFFLSLQTQIKNMLVQPFESAERKQLWDKIQQTINAAAKKEEAGELA